MPSNSSYPKYLEYFNKKIISPKSHLHKDTVCLLTGSGLYLEVLIRRDLDKGTEQTLLYMYDIHRITEWPWFKWTSKII